MAQLVEITKVAVAPKHFTARVRIANGGPLMTDEDLVGTTYVYRLLPEICDHTCLGDSGSTFKDVMGSTELAHLLEHVAIELMARTNLAGDITCGRTWEVTGEPRTYDVQLACPDDVLVASALSSAAWILQWAYSGGAEPEPDVDAIVSGIRELVQHAEQEAQRLEAAEAAERDDADGQAAGEDAGEPEDPAESEGSAADEDEPHATNPDPAADAAASDEGGDNPTPHDVN